MKLLAVNINGQVLGVNILSWSTPTVSGCTPFLAIADNGVIPANYCNISSVTNWDKLGGNTTLSQGEVKAEIVKLIPNTPTEPQYRILETYTSVGLNSMTKVGNTLVFGGTLSGTTFLTGVTDSGVTKATFATYTGTTAPSTYKTISSVNYYTGTTAPTTYYNKTQINSYTGATSTAIGNRLLTSIYSTYTGTTVPTTYYNKTQINSYTGATNTAIGNRLLTSTYSNYTGTTVPTTYYNKTQINSYTGATNTAIGNRLLTSIYSTYTGTTVPNTYATKANAVTGATNLGSGNALYTSVSANKIQLKSISGGTGISISTTANQINICSTASGAVWGGITGNITGQTDLNNCLNSKQATITGGATTITASNLTASRALVSDGSGKVGVSTITSAQIGYLSGTTTNILPLINSKQATITGGATSIVSSNLTASRALISDGSGKVAVSSTISDTELGYLDGVTSNVQTQLNNRITGTTTNIFANVADTQVMLRSGSTIAGRNLINVTGITATHTGVAAPLDFANIEVTTDGDSDLDNVTLANGLYVGQIINIYCKAVGTSTDTLKITPATPLGFTNILFMGTPLGKGASFVWTASGWASIGVYGNGFNLLRTTANQTINAGAATFVDITDLTFPVKNGQVYSFHFYITFQAANTATGWKAGVNAPTGILDFWAQSAIIANGAAGVATQTERHNTVRDDMTLLTSTVTAGVDLAIRIDGRYISTQDGTFAARFANELAANTDIVVQKGSYGWWY
jgi:hypothetical protein